MIFLGAKDDNHRLNNLTDVHHRNGLYSRERIESKLDYDELNRRKMSLTMTDGYYHRTVLARHVFHANIKQTLTRSMRETPV